MVLYLARNESVNLLDKAASDNSLHIRKLSGNFNLTEFVAKDMRRYAGSKFFCVDRLAITEKDNEFLGALESLQMMYSMRIIVIYETAQHMEHLNSLTRGLVNIGVYDIVTATDTDEKQEQIYECFSETGMLKHKPKAKKSRDYDDDYDEDEPEEEKETLAQSLILKEMEDEQYRFDCLNVKIGIIGATRRVGATTLALGLANFIKNHGGTSCYVALNAHGHLESIATAQGFDTEEDYFTFNTIDFYEGMMPKHDYNFVVMDFGDMKREAVRKYKESEIHLLCGASQERFEVVEFAEALKQIKSVQPQIITYTPNPEYAKFFNSSVTDSPIIVKPVKKMPDFKTNGIVFKGIVFKGIVEDYIVETSKRL
jgi:hypothetical protein